MILDLTGIDLIDPNDPFFSQNVDEVTPNIGAGFFYYTDKYYLAVICP